MTPSRHIAIGVAGRFHADRMIQALEGGGYTTTLFTTLPRSRFPELSPDRIRPFLWPEIFFRLFKGTGLQNVGGVYKMAAFGRRFRRALDALPTPPDLCVSWSSFGLEALRRPRRPRHAVVRDSAHIALQVEILQREYEKRGRRFPDHRVVTARETEEYALADAILLPSEFARRSFLDRGVPAEKLAVVRLGVDTGLFRPAPEPRRGGPLRVVYFGALSLQKGVPYLLEALADVPPSEVELHLVGTVEPEMRPWLHRHPRARVRPPMPQKALADFAREMDVFVFPSLHDGFGMVLPQAMASGLVPIATSHCGASELIEPGRNGFVVPPADAEALRDRILALRDPALRTPLRDEVLRTAVRHDWDAYGAQILEWARGLLS